MAKTNTLIDFPRCHIPRSPSRRKCSRNCGEKKEKEGKEETIDVFCPFRRNCRGNLRGKV